MKTLRVGSPTFESLTLYPGGWFQSARVAPFPQLPPPLGCEAVGMLRVSRNDSDAVYDIIRPVLTCVFIGSDGGTNPLPKIVAGISLVGQVNCLRSRIWIQ